MQQFPRDGHFFEVLCKFVDFNSIFDRFIYLETNIFIIIIIIIIIINITIAIIIIIIIIIIITIFVIRQGLALKRDYL